jgi:Legionella pneumophila major outer membrane protein precursor
MDSSQRSERLKKLIGIFLFACTAQAQAVSTHSDSTFVFADALIWQLRAGAADNWGQQIGTNGSTSIFNVLDAPYEWNTGIRLGVGHEFNQGSYDVVLAFTHYQANASNQASGSVISAFNGNYFANNLNGTALDFPYRNANIRYQFYYNTFDLNLGTNYEIANIVVFHPYLGLKAASLKQNIYSNWLGPIGPTNFTAATEDLKNDFSGIGPSLGVDSRWFVYTNGNQSVDLVGNIVAGLLYGHTSISDVYTNNVPVTITIYNASINGASPMFDGLLGVQWNKQFAKSDMSVRVGYEAQIWFNQIQFYSLNMGKVNRPISLQGGNIEFRYNF